MFQGMGDTTDVDPEAKVGRALPEGPGPDRGSQPGSDQLVDRVAQPNLPLFTESLNGGGHIVIEGHCGTHDSNYNAS
jgi:hypothetical protein